MAPSMVWACGAVLGGGREGVGVRSDRVMVRIM